MKLDLKRIIEKLSPEYDPNRRKFLKGALALGAALAIPGIVEKAANAATPHTPSYMGGVPVQAPALPENTVGGEELLSSLRHWDRTLAATLKMPDGNEHLVAYRIGDGKLDDVTEELYAIAHKELGPIMKPKLLPNGAGIGYIQNGRLFVYDRNLKKIMPITDSHLNVQDFAWRTLRLEDDSGNITTEGPLQVVVNDERKRLHKFTIRPSGVTHSELYPQFGKGESWAIQDISVEPQFGDLMLYSIVTPAGKKAWYLSYITDNADTFLPREKYDDVYDELAEKLEKGEPLPKSSFEFLSGAPYATWYGWRGLVYVGKPNGAKHYDIRRVKLGKEEDAQYDEVLGPVKKGQDPGHWNSFKHSRNLATSIDARPVLNLEEFTENAAGDIFAEAYLAVATGDKKGVEVVGVGKRFEGDIEDMGYVTVVKPQDLSQYLQSLSLGTDYTVTNVDWRKSGSLRLKFEPDK